MQVSINALIRFTTVFYTVLDMLRRQVGYHFSVGIE